MSSHLEISLARETDNYPPPCSTKQLQLARQEHNPRPRKEFDFSDPIVTPIKNKQPIHPRPTKVTNAYIACVLHTCRNNRKNNPNNYCRVQNVPRHQSSTERYNTTDNSDLISGPITKNIATAGQRHMEPTYSCLLISGSSWAAICASTELPSPLFNSKYVSERHAL